MILDVADREGPGFEAEVRWVTGISSFLKSITLFTALAFAALAASCKADGPDPQATSSRLLCSAAFEEWS